MTGDPILLNRDGYYFLGELVCCCFRAHVEGVLTNFRVHALNIRFVLVRLLKEIEVSYYDFFFRSAISKFRILLMTIKRENDIPNLEKFRQELRLQRRRS